MPSKSLLKRGFKTRAEQIAIEYRETLGLSKFKPLDAFTLAEHLDVPIFTVNEIFEGNETIPAYATMNNVHKFDAMWMPNSYGEKMIIYNSHHSYFRQQSSLMHELAHIILGHTVPEDISRACMLYNLHYYNKEHEQEAKFLGGCLQITKPSLLWTLKENWSLEKISQYYNASLEMVEYRMRVSGALKQSYYKKKVS